MDVPGCSVRFRQLQTTRRIRLGQVWATSRRRDQVVELLLATFSTSNAQASLLWWITKAICQG